MGTSSWIPQCARCRVDGWRGGVRSGIVPRPQPGSVCGTLATKTGHGHQLSQAEPLMRRIRARCVQKRAASDVKRRYSSVVRSMGRFLGSVDDGTDLPTHPD